MRRRAASSPAGRVSPPERCSLPLPRPAALVALACVACLLLVSSATADAVSPPSITLAINGERGGSGWYRSDVTVAWTVSDATGISSSNGCGTTLLSRDTPGTTLTCSASNNANPPLSSSVSVTIKLDKTPPIVTDGRPARRPDASGWYTRPVSFSFKGEDGLSGIDACPPVKYEGPDAESASVTATCRDRAGNTGTRSFPLKYDAHPPVLSSVSVESGDGANIVRWRASSDAVATAVRRIARGARGPGKRVFRGGGSRFVDRGITNGLEYRYVVQAYDRAHNRSKQVSKLALPKVVTLRRLSYVPRVAGPPTLRLPRVRGATYYHVQLFRRSTRLLAAWPVRPWLALRGTWTYAGRRYRLRPGRYRWYAWAGLGARRAGRYDQLGRADFRVIRTPRK